MYPIVRQIKELIRARRMPDLHLLDSHVSHHRCWPQDLDYMVEMNNGRILSILDIGRVALGQRAGLLKALAQQRWGLTVAGSSVRYRKRIRPFVKFRVISKCVGWSERFIYMEQTLWIGEDCAVQALFRTAVTDHNGIVNPARVMQAMGVDVPAPQKPAWVQAWIDADNTRPWPPQEDTPRPERLLAS